MNRLTTIRYLIATTLVFTALTAAMTYPQVLHLTDTVHDDGDPLLNAWALAWVAHQLPRAPAHLFDANIFYPERRTLAFSETLLAPGIAAAPLHWMGVGPLLVYNIVFLSGFIVSGVGVALLTRSLTGNAVAGVIGGIVFAFLPYRIDHYPHLQLQQTQCLPFAFWAFHRLLRTNRVRDGLLFGAFTAGQVLSCMYYGLFLVPYMIVVCSALLIFDRTMPRQRIAALVAAGALALVAVLPVGIAYMGAHETVGERSSEEVAAGSAAIRNYLGPAEFNLLYGDAFKRFADSERRLFPGFIAIALAGVAMAYAFGRTKPSGSLVDGQGSPAWSVDQRRAVIAYALGLLLAFDLSLGFNGISYGVLYKYLLPFRGLRIPARMGIIVGFSLAVLAGFGADRLLRGRRRALAIAIAVLMLLEYASKPLDLRQIPPPPESYADMLKDRGDGPTAVVFEFPPSPLDDPTYMYYSTFHWQNLVNGYSGFFPPSYSQLEGAMRTFPDQASFDAIKSHGPRYLLIHGERLYGGRYEQLIPELAKRKDLTLISQRPALGPGGHRDISLYRISYADAP